MYLRTASLKLICLRFGVGKVSVVKQTCIDNHQSKYTMFYTNMLVIFFLIFKFIVISRHVDLFFKGILHHFLIKCH